MLVVAKRKLGIKANKQENKRYIDIEREVGGWRRRTKLDLHFIIEIKFD